MQCFFLKSVSLPPFSFPWSSQFAFSSCSCFPQGIFPPILLTYDLNDSLNNNNPDDGEPVAAPPGTPAAQPGETYEHEVFSRLLEGLEGLDRQLNLAANEALRDVMEFWNNPETRSRRTRWNAIRALKSSIERTYGITIGEGSAQNARRSHNLQPSSWSMGELQTLKDTLEREDPVFRSATKRVFRAREFPLENGQTTYGLVYDEAPDTVFLFDAASRNVAGHIDMVAFQMSLVHEQTHCFMFANPEKMDAFSRKFWIITERRTVPCISISPTNVVTSRSVLGTGGRPVPLGGTVSEYATTGESDPPFGFEDIAETVMAMFVNINLVRDFPERKEFILANLPPTMFAGQPAGGVGANPGNYGLFQWRQGVKNDKEYFSYTFLPIGRIKNWFCLSPTIFGPDIFEDMRRTMGLPPTPRAGTE